MPAGNSTLSIDPWPLTVTENTPVGTVVATMTASDPDGLRANSAVTLANATYFRAVEVSPGIYNLVVNGPIDFEALASGKIDIIANVADTNNARDRHTISITIADAVENAAPGKPVLNGSTVAEDAANGTVVGELSATDADGDTLTYSLTDDAGGRFALVNENGVTKLVVNGALDYETATSHQAIVKVSDGKGGEATETFTIDVTDVSESTNLPPRDISLSATGVAENAAPGTIIGILSATDPEGQSITYTLSDDAGGRFSLTTISGVTRVVVNGALDYETAASHDIKVIASDGVNQTEQTITLGVADVPEQTYGITLPENAAEGMLVATLATPVGSDAGMVQFIGMVNGVDSSQYFNAVYADAAGEWQIFTTGNSFDFESTNTSELSFYVIDYATGAEIWMPITLEITDVDETPSDNQAPTDLEISSTTIKESARTGFTVGTLSATDPDGDAITWSLVAGQGDNDAKFDLKVVNGETRVVLKNPLDHETSGGVYDLIVRATDGEGNFTDKAIQITAEDEPFAISGVPTGKNYMSVVESAPTGTQLGFIWDYDYDDGFVPTTARLTDDAGGMFSITQGFTFDRFTGTNIPREFLTVNGDLDFESDDKYSVTIEVTGADGTTRERTIDVHVVDAAEATDPGIQPEGTITIDANTALAASNGGVNWSTYLDAYFDKILGNLPSFYPNGSGWSAANPATEMRMLNNTSDNTLISIKGSGFLYNWADPISGEDAHIITGTITDVAFGSAGAVGSATQNDLVNTELTISGLDLSNGSDPMNRLFGEAQIFTQTWMYGNTSQPSDIEFTKAILASYAQNFKGSSEGDTYAGTIFADMIEGNGGADALAGGGGNDDIDGGDGADTAFFSGNKSDYTVTDNGNGTWTVTDNRTTGETDGVDTLENIEKLQFADQAIDLVTTENQPPSTPTLSANSVAENSANGTVVGVLSATDADGGTLTYTLTNDANGNFALVTENGVTSLVVNAALDYETFTSHSVAVKVSDGNGGETSQTFTINVTDVVETQPETPAGTITINASGSAGIDFESYIRGGFLTGTSGSGMPVFDNGGTFSGEEMFIGYGAGAASKYVLMHGNLGYNFATHTVAGTANTIQYGTRGAGSYDANGYFVGGNAELTITGLNLFNAVPTNPGEEATIEANGPIHNFATAHMYGASGDLSRLSKYADALDEYQQNFTGSAGNDTFTGGRFADTIAGGGGNDTIDGGGGIDTAYFDGVFGGPSSNYSFTGGTGGAPLVITDNRSTGGTGVDTLTNVEILKFKNLTYDFVNHRANYTPTNLALDDAEIESNAAVGTVVGSIAVTDRDTADTHTLVLVDNAGGRFTLDGTAIKVAGTLGADDYTVRVRVTDGAGNEFEKDLTIDVTQTGPANTAPTGLALSANAVAEDAANGTVVGTLSATDADGDALTYTLTGDAGGKFSIVTDGGISRLVVNGALDFETAESHEVVVKVSDGRGGETSQTFTVSVTDVVERVNTAPTGLSLSANTVAENAANGTVIGVLSATDANGDALTYSLTGNAGGKFSIVTDGGISRLVVNGALDFETATSHQVTVKVTDGHGGEATQSFAVSVTDVVENVPAGTITLDASRANGINFDAYIAGQFLTGTTGGGMPVFDNGGSFNGSEMFIGYGSGASSKYVLMDGSLQYHFATHTVAGTANVVEYGTRGSGSFNASGQFVGGNVELRITGLDLSNAIPTNPTEEAAIEANGPIHNFAVAHMYGATGDLSRLSKYVEALDAYAQNFVSSAGNDTYVGTRFGDTITGSIGNDTFDGGAGDDLIIYSGVKAGYVVATTASGAVTITHLATGAVSTLTNIENARFSDGTIELIDGDNKAPTDLRLSAATVSEDAAINTVIGTLSATDEDGDPLAYTLTNDAQGRFKLVTTGGVTQLVLAAAVDYETATSHSVTVQVGDGKGGVATQTFVIAVEDVVNEQNTAPTGLALSNATVAENVAAGTIVGQLSAEDAQGDDIVWSLAGGGGGKFALETVDGVTRLVVNGKLDYETRNSYDVTLTASDGELSTDQTFTIGIRDVAEVIQGGGGSETLRGDQTADVLRGRGGNDSLIGGGGADRLVGGGGADTFIFSAVGHSNAKAFDTIVDFKPRQGDIIDLSGIDANKGRSGNQSFDFIGRDDFSGTAGELRFEKSGGRTIIEGDVNGDGDADFVLHLLGGINLKEDFLIL